MKCLSFKIKVGNSIANQIISYYLYTENSQPDIWVETYCRVNRSSCLTIGESPQIRTIVVKWLLLSGNRDMHCSVPFIEINSLVPVSIDGKPNWRKWNQKTDTNGRFEAKNDKMMAWITLQQSVVAQKSVRTICKQKIRMWSRINYIIVWQLSVFVSMRVHLFVYCYCIARIYGHMNNRTNTTIVFGCVHYVINKASCFER